MAVIPGQPDKVLKNSNRIVLIKREVIRRVVTTHEQGPPGVSGLPGLKGSEGVQGPQGPLGLTPIPNQLVFFITENTRNRFTLSSVPIVNSVLVAMNGVFQHGWTLDGLDIVLNTPAEKDDFILVFWFESV
jgi:hypothetical protein